MPEPAEPSLDQRVVRAIGDSYALEGEIGRGGMSVVYRARDLRLNRPVAIKVLPPGLALDAGVRVRFTREAQTAAQLSHPHIVSIYDVGERDGIAFLVMALLTGGNLATLLAHEHRVPVEEARRFLREVADALDYAHQRGVIHRDIKPDNILLDQAGRAVVTDFGIAWAMESASRLTATGAAVGTPAYMSPEQAVGDRVLDGRCDIYSLGVVGYQMVTGRVPFTAANAMALLLKHVTEAPRPVLDLRPDTPPALAAAIERALLKSPEDRWPAAGTLRDALASDARPAPAWRSERVEPVRYTSPVPLNRRDRRARESRRVVETRDPSPVPTTAPAPAPPSSGAVMQGDLVLEPAHLATLTPEQRKDLRLWGGRVHLLDRVKAMRAGTWATFAITIAASVAFVAGLSEPEAWPLAFSPIIPFFLIRKTWRRRASLHESGLRLRRVLAMPRAKWVIPNASAPTPKQLAKVDPKKDVLEGAAGAAVREAAEDRQAILGILASLTKADRKMLPDVEPAVNALVERIGHLARMVNRLDGQVDHAALEDLDARIATMEREGLSLEGERRLALLKRQRTSLLELAETRSTLLQQLDNAVLMLGNLRLDLVRLRTSGLGAGLSDVSSATQEVRALSREIGLLLEAAEEVRTS